MAPEQPSQNNQDQQAASAAFPASQTPPPMVTPHPQAAGNDNDYPGKTLGIVGLIVDFFMPLIGLVLSAVALHQSKKAGRSNTPALVGLILGIVFMMVITAGFVVALVLATFGGVQEKARDTERKSDVMYLQSQLEAFYEKNGHVYPATLDVLREAPGAQQSSFVGPQGETYSYKATPTGCTNDCSGYSLSARLEDGTNFVRNSLEQ